MELSDHVDQYAEAAPSNVNSGEPAVVLVATALETVSGPFVSSTR